VVGFGLSDRQSFRARQWKETPTLSNTQHATTRTLDHNPSVRVSTETKSSYKTTELIAYVAAVIGVLIASAVVDVSDFGAQEAWFYITLLTIGYMTSRGLAKSGSRDFFGSDVRSAFDANDR
jgi:hypothetical protein